MYSGYLAGCTVFLDSNKNGVLDADEAEATTTPYGRFELAVMEDLDLADKNVVVKTGGDCKDTSTDLNLAVEMTVKATCATGGMDSGGMVNLITAIQGLLAVDDTYWQDSRAPLAADDAAKRRVIIGSGLALPADFDACKYDPLSAAWSASATEQTAFANFVRTNVELTTLVKTLSDVTGYADEATYNQASKAILRGIATLFEDFSRIAGQTGVEACENKGFDASECGAVDCCNYDDGSCMSGVGHDLCSGDMPCAAECITGTCDSFADASKPECAACAACQGDPSPLASPPSPAPEMPGTTFETKPAKEFKITVTVAGTVDTFDKAGYEAGMSAILLCEAPLCQVAIAVTAASVNVEATVTDATSGGGAVAMADTLKTLTKEDLQARITAVLPGLVVESAATVTAPIEVELIVPVAAPVAASPSPPAEPDRVGGPGVGLTKGSDQTTTNDAGLGAGLGLGLGLPIFCAFLFFLHVQMNFEDGKRSKYIKYRFSHTNAQINFGYMPKESRDALWAEIKAPAEQSSRETGVEIPAPKEEKTDTV